MSLLLILVGFIPATAFPIVYAFRPWRSTRPGRGLMYRALADMVLVDTAAVALVLPVPVWVRQVGGLLFIAALWYMFIALLLTPRQPLDD